MYRNMILLFVLSLFAVACAPMGVHDAVPLDKIPNVSDVSNQYYIQVGDTVRVSVSNVTNSLGSQGSSSIEFPVRPDGKLLLPLLKDPIMVAGYTTKQVRDNLKIVYKKYVRDPSVLVNIVAFSPRVVYVTGEIKGTPTPIPYTTDLTALRAVAFAGYDTLRANLQNVVVVRSQGAEEKPLVMALHLKDAIKNVDIRQDIKLMPNDVVVIPKKRIVALNDFIDQYINKNVPLPGLTYGVASIYAADRVVNNQ